MIGTVRNFYLTGNTARGFVHVLPSSLQSLTHLHILQGGSKREKSSLFKQLGDELKEDHEIWFLHSPVDHTLLEGIIVPRLKWGVVDESPPHQFHLDTALSGLNIHYIDWTRIGGIEPAADVQAKILQLTDDMMRTYELAHECFRNALNVHDEWEAIYIAAMDFQAANELTNLWKQKLYQNQSREKKSRIDYRFLGAATPKGANDFILDLTNELPHRYFIKGRPGSGKSTMLRKLADYGIESGFDVEIYHCGFDPQSLDMLIVRELGFAIFDSTAPHEYDPDPSREGDEMIDMYPVCFPPGTDEAHEDALTAIAGRYKSLMKQGTAYLAEAKTLRGELDDLYEQVLDSDRLKRFNLLKGMIKSS